MPSKTKRPTTGRKDADKTQRERFIEAARAVGVDETGREFESAIKRIMPPKNSTHAIAKRDGS